MTIELFDIGNTNYQNKGDHILNTIIINPRIEWSLTDNLWSFEFELPINNELGIWPQHRQVIRTPTPAFDEPQLFYITSTEEEFGYVKVYAIHIYNKLNHLLVEKNPGYYYPSNIAIETMEGADGFSSLGMPFTVYSDLGEMNVLSKEYKGKSVLKALTDYSDPDSLVSKTNSEFIANNFNLRFVKQIGSDRGVDIRIGRDVSDFYDTRDTKEVIGRIKPISGDGIEGGYVHLGDFNPEFHTTVQVIYPDIKISDRGSVSVSSMRSRMDKVDEEHIKQRDRKHRDSATVNGDLDRLERDEERLEERMEAREESHGDAEEYYVDDIIDIKVRKVGLDIKIESLELRYGLVKSEDIEKKEVEYKYKWEIQRALREAATKEFEERHVHRHLTSYELSIEILDEVKELQDIRPGDTVRLLNIRGNKFGDDNRLTKYTYDPLERRYIDMTIGNETPSISLQTGGSGGDGGWSRGSDGGDGGPSSIEGFYYDPKEDNLAAGEAAERMTMIDPDTNELVGRRLIDSKNSNIFGGTGSITDSEYSNSIGNKSSKINSSDKASIIGSDDSNVSGSDGALILGGVNNEVENVRRSTIIGGHSNSIRKGTYDSYDAMILGGTGNEIIGSSNSSISNGQYSTVENSDGSSIVSSSGSVIRGGRSNTIHGGSGCLVDNCRDTTVIGSHGVLISDRTRATVVGGKKIDISDFLRTSNISELLAEHDSKIVVGDTGLEATFSDDLEIVSVEEDPGAVPSSIELPLNGNRKGHFKATVHFLHTFSTRSRPQSPFIRYRHESIHDIEVSWDGFEITNQTVNSEVIESNDKFEYEDLRFEIDEHKRLHLAGYQHLIWYEWDGVFTPLFSRFKFSYEDAFLSVEENPDELPDEILGQLEEEEDNNE